MNDEQDLKKVLLQARKQFQTANYDLAKEKLQIFKEPNIAVENNLLIIEHLVNRDNTDVVLNSLMKLLTQEDIKLYTKSYNPKNQAREPIHIDHEYLYWNIIIIALKLGKLKTATLVANEASFLCGGFYQKTSLYILSTLLQAQLQDSKTASCIGCFDKYWKIGNNYHKYQQQCKVYSILCSINFIRFLLKLGLLEQAKNQYMLKLGISQQQLFESIAQKNTQNGLHDNYSTIIKQAMLPFQVHQQFLHAEIQLYHKKHHNSIKILSDMVLDWQVKNNRAERIQILANHNIALTYCIIGKTAIGKKMLFQAIQKLRIINEKEPQDSQRLVLYQYAKENLVYAYLQNCISFQEAYTYINKLGINQSYKMNYRKAQICINFYHELLQKYSRLVPWEDIHDQYDTVFYYPNEPYVGQKSKNKNIHYANKKHFYRRYVLSSWEDHFGQNGKKQQRQVQAHQEEKQELSLRIKTILQQAQEFLKQALILLSAQQDIKASLTLEHPISQKINESIHADHDKFKKSILVILSYLSLCQCDWIRCIRYGKQFQKLAYDKSDQYYHVLSYMVEAYCEMGKYTQAYETTHIIYSNGVNQQTPIRVRDSMNLTSAFFEDSNYMISFLFNMAVLHSRDNRIPESHQAIHKLMNQMQIMHNSYQANMPLSLVDLLIHYNLKTQNYSSALQMIKRKRILTLPNVNGNRSLLKVTK